MIAARTIRDFSSDDKPAPVKPRHVIGLDLGKVSDPSALAMLRWFPATRQTPQSAYNVITLKRWALGTPYTEIVDNLVKFYELPELKASPPLLVVDATGVGAAVCEMIPQTMTAAKMPGSWCQVSITGGSAVTNVGMGRWNVSKKQLASVVQVVLGNRRLLVAPEQPERETLLRELGTFQVKITAAGNESFEAWRESAHDDMVLAVALAVWAAETMPGLWNPPPPLARRLRA
jgi:hypothetical protein